MTEKDESNELDFRNLLERIVADPKREAEWLDMLSQLEYVGCRKIMKSVPYEAVSQEVLLHISEEAAHAVLLKGLVGSDSSSWQKNPLSEMGWRYFQSLDLEISHLQGIGGFNYPAVSWVIERRVLQVYPLYLGLTQNADVKRIVAKILAQEKRHGGQFERVEYPTGLREKMIAIETRFWREFVEDLEVYLGGGKGAELSHRFSGRADFTQLHATD